MDRSAFASKLAGVVICVGVLYVGVAAHAGGVKSDSEVKITGVASKPDAAGKQTVTITMVHNKDWHTYANPVGNEDFESNQTKVSFKAKQTPKSVKIEYPAGHPSKDKVNVYEDRVEIKATLVRANGDTSPLEVSVRIIACNDKLGMCLLPATVKLTLKE